MRAGTHLFLKMIKKLKLWWWCTWQSNYKMDLVVVVMGEENLGGNCGALNCFLNFRWMTITLILLIMYFWTAAQYIEKGSLFPPLMNESVLLWKFCLSISLWTLYFSLSLEKSNSVSSYWKLNDRALELLFTGEYFTGSFTVWSLYLRSIMESCF